jgi:hypothetical protein
MTLRSPVVHSSFDGKYCLHLQVRTVQQATQETGEATQLGTVPRNVCEIIPDYTAYDLRLLVYDV